MTPIKRNLNYQFTAAPLRLRIRWASYTLTISTGFHVDRTDAKGKPQWDGSRCKTNTTHGTAKIPASVINQQLSALEIKINDIFSTFELRDRIPSKEEFREMLTPESRRSDFASAFDAYVREGTQVRQWSENTRKSVIQIKTLTLAFRHNLAMEEITGDLLNEWIIFQQTHKTGDSRKKKQDTGGYANNVIRKHCHIMRRFLKWAAKKELIPFQVYRDFTPDIKTIGKDIIYLTWEELITLKNAPLEPGSEKDKVRDFFVFCAMTSLRFSDAHALMKTDISGESLRIVTQKTSETLIIELNSHAKNILGKYEGTLSPYALPRVTLNQVNYQMKELGRLLGFDTPVKISQYYGGERVDKVVPKYELLSSHCARRTFITNAIDMGIPPHVVMKWSGHSSMEAMKPYLAVVDKTKSDYMKKFNRE